jgi:hypothetical protein
MEGIPFEENPRYDVICECAKRGNKTMISAISSTTKYSNKFLCIKELAVTHIIYVLFISVQYMLLYPLLRTLSWNLRSVRTM